jgi:hypothetical protein
MNRRAGSVALMVWLSLTVACGGEFLDDDWAAIEDDLGGGLGSRFFGMHVHQPDTRPWPSVGFGTYRIWDVGGCFWADIATRRGVYDWAKLDRVVSIARNHGVDIVYTFGKTPRWASSHPDADCNANEPGTCYPPADIRDWKDFVAAITKRYAGRIDYWELWNEPPGASFYSGNTGRLVDMARAAYPIIRNSARAARVVSPSPQGNFAHRFMDEYLSAGGDRFLDVVAFHGYLGKLPSGERTPPEQLVGNLKEMKAVMAKHGVGSKPLWDTEHSFGVGSSLTMDERSGWLVRHVLLSWSGNVRRSFWYAWDGDPATAFGILWDKDTRQLLKPGIALGVVTDWIRGARMNGRCDKSPDGVWTCDFTRSGGKEVRAIWHPAGNVAHSVAQRFNKYQDVYGNTHAIPASGSITIGPQPVLLQ